MTPDTTNSTILSLRPFQTHSYCAALNCHVIHNRFTLHEETFPAIYSIQMAPTEPNRLQVTPSCPLVAPLSSFPGVHLSFTAMLHCDWPYEMASSPLPFSFAPTTTSYRAGAIFKFEMCQSVPRHPVQNITFVLKSSADSFLTNLLHQMAKLTHRFLCSSASALYKGRQLFGTVDSLILALGMPYLNAT